MTNLGLAEDTRLIEMAKFLRHDECPKCGSRDNLAIYEDHEICFTEGCGYLRQTNGEEMDQHPIRHFKDRDVTPLPQKDQSGIPNRSINQGTVAKYQVTVDQDENSGVDHVYPYFDEEGAHVANKIRRKGEKAFYWEGDAERGVLFGQQVFKPGGKAITIVEGECDALATFQLTGSRYPCVSVKSASAAKKDCVSSFEYLNSFDKIVVCMDNDEPGKRAATQIAQLFAPGKVHVLTLEKCKDPNEYLMKDLNREFVDEWYKAPAYMPDGLLIGNDPSLLSDIIDYKEPHCIPYPWEGLNRAVYGMRLSEMTLLTADTGIGKTSYIKEMEYKLLMDKELQEKGYGIGFLHFEEPKRDVALGIMSVHKSKPYHLPDVHKTREELTEAYNEVINTERVVIYDHFGSNNIDTVLNKIRHMVALGCRYIFVDHLTIIVSDQAGDERKQLDEISTKLKMLTMELNISVVCVIHINRQGLVRGSAGPEQVANNVIRLERDKKDTDEWRRNVTRIVVEKCRLSGKTGPAAYVYYDPMTGRLVELSKESADIYESGGSIAGNEFEVYK